MNSSKNNSETEQTILTKPASLNQKINSHKKSIAEKVIKANAAITESFDSNCFVLGYN